VSTIWSRKVGLHIDGISESLSHGALVKLTSLPFSSILSFSFFL